MGKDQQSRERRYSLIYNLAEKTSQTMNIFPGDGEPQSQTVQPGQHGAH